MSGIQSLPTWTFNMPFAGRFSFGPGNIPKNLSRIKNAVFTLATALAAKTAFSLNDGEQLLVIKATKGDQTETIVTRGMQSLGEGDPADRIFSDLTKAAEGSGITLERLDTIPTGDVSVSKVLECEQAFPYPGPMVQENSEYPVVSDKITVYSGVPQAGNHTSFFGETAAEMVQKDACISSSFDTMTIVILSIISALFVAGFVWAFRDTSKPKPNNASTHPELSAPLLSAHQNPAEATTELQHSSTDPQV